MLTGDKGLTAKQIGKSCGIIGTTDKYELNLNDVLKEVKDSVNLQELNEDLERIKSQKS